MDIHVEQGCPQCGAPVTLHETDRLLSCPFCGVKNFLRSNSTFRYFLPDKLEESEKEYLLYAPYIRLKSNIFHITESGISYKVMDTTQLGFEIPGLPPTLGFRPQAMKLSRLTPETKGRFLRLSLKVKVILEKAIQLSRIAQPRGEDLYHRAFLGDTISIIYLPMRRDETHLIDSVTNSQLIDLEKISSYPLKGTNFHKNWQVHFLPALCPRCGWNLEGEADCLVPTCTNCDTAWEISDKGLQRLEWQIQPGDNHTGLYLPFWKVYAHLPKLKIYSFADFIRRTNQPLIPRPDWEEKTMSFMVPAFKLRPKIFLQIARNMTLSQWRLQLEPGHIDPNLYPVNFPQSEAKQAIKVTTAAAATSPKDILPFLPETRIKQTTCSLVYLPFIDKGHDWYQPQTSASIAKSILRFGRKL